MALDDRSLPFIEKNPTGQLHSPSMTRQYRSSRELHSLFNDPYLTVTEDSTLSLNDQV
ncbi:uncharacterized protein PGTG_20586 [Puccinia graminis f. sp. tritici CRL 75-36-700-3]|uniref:Uncharacterized protein n=1 Tax=Puccinia graminis f. sp. tritici (strain CRL 75-36-700-3 / race SCCL) TaxID=418459 RepID=H6QNY2_PUCGT|nr:uncharacterized protein PGTG_20586 [Puccinia graminis f. sp. tritici CRL 75-36-700-3]EHS62461.1 hypothetical protein PGTG_20586 [Puccinia graminis f. sp. tritici CRL 75-36-700-3]